MKLHVNDDNKLEMRNSLVHYLKERITDVGEDFVASYMSKVHFIAEVCSETLSDIAKQGGNQQYIDLSSQKNKVAPVIEEKIALLFNRRLHGTTLQRFTDYVMDFCEQEAKIQRTKDKKIDTNEELAFIVDFMQLRWKGVDKEVLGEIWHHCMNHAKYATTNFPFTVLNSHNQWNRERSEYQNWQKNGTSLSESQFLTKIHEDAIYQLPQYLSNALDTVNGVVNKELRSDPLYRYAFRIFKSVQEQFPQVTKMKPVGWGKLARNYSEGDGQDEYVEYQQILDAKEFKGLDSSSAIDWGFANQISLPTVMEQAKENGEKPVQVLIECMLKHAKAVVGHNNMIDLKNDLMFIMQRFNTPEHYQDTMSVKDMEKNMPLQDLVANPVSKAFMLALKYHIEPSFEEKLMRQADDGNLYSDNLKQQIFAVLGEEPVVKQTVRNRRKPA